MARLIPIIMFTLSLALSSCSSTATQESTGEYIDSSAITAKIKAEYASSKDVDILDVKVTTFKGVVQLSGFVSSYKEKIMAETIARKVKGVKKVENDIVVK